MSRARLGLYIFGRASLFANCYELQPTFSQLLARPLQLALVPGEHYGDCQRAAGDVPASQPVDGLEHMAGIVHHMAQQWEAAAQAWARQQQPGQDAAAAAAGAVEQAVLATAPPADEAQEGEGEGQDGDAEEAAGSDGSADEEGSGDEEAAEGMQE